MITLGDTILCAADGGEHDAHLVGVGASLAQHTGRSLGVLQVVPVLGTGGAAEGAIAQPMPSSATADPDAARLRLTDLAAGVGYDHATCEVVQGAPLPVLSERSRRPEIGWLVVGDAGGGALRTAALGSVTRSLLTDAGCPVLIVPEGAEPAAVAGTETVLCAIGDDGATAAATTAVAGGLAADLDASLTLVHVVGDLAAGPRAVAGGRVGRLLARCLAAVPVMVDVRRLTLCGPPVETIVDLADAEGAGIVVVGAPRHGPMLSALGRSVTHGLLATITDRLAVVAAGAPGHPGDAAGDGEPGHG